MTNAVSGVTGLAKRLGRPILGIGFVLGAAAAVAGCGASSTPSAVVITQTVSTQTVAASKPAAAPLVRAADVSAAARGYRVTLTMAGSVASERVYIRSSGSYSPTAHEADMTLEMNLPGSSSPGKLRVRVLYAGDTIYEELPPELASRLPGGKSWITVNLSQLGKLTGVPGYGALMNSSSSMSSSMDDPGEYLDFLRATATGTVKDVGQERVNGLATTHYQADVDLAKLPNAVPVADRKGIRQLIAQLQAKGLGTQMLVNAWIDGSNLVRRIQVSYVLEAAPSSVFTATENFLDYGPQPAAKLPSPAQTMNIVALESSESQAGQGGSSSGCSGCGSGQQASESSLAAVAQ